MATTALPYMESRKLLDTAVRESSEKTEIVKVQEKTGSYNYNIISKLNIRLTAISVYSHTNTSLLIMSTVKIISNMHKIKLIIKT